MSKLYYTAPPDDQFEELKLKAIEIWGTYDDFGCYSSKKIERVKGMNNISDNFMFIVAMFDIFNQKKLADKLSEETRLAVRKRMIDGGNPFQYIMF